MHQTIRISLLLAFSLLSITSQGQKSLLKQAHKLFDAEQYTDALALYNKYDKIDSNKDAMYNRAVASFYTGGPTKAIEYFNSAYTLGQKNPLAFYYTARSYMSLGQYDDAVVFFKNYLRKGKDKELLMKTKDDIIRCANAKKLMFRDQLAYAENMGPSVNTRYNEIKPLISPNNVNKFYFSSDRDISTGGKRNEKGLKDDLYGNYGYDLYAVELSNGNWTSVYPFNSLQNTAQQEILESFNKDGSVMFYRRGVDPERLNFFVDTFSVDVEQRMFPTQIDSPVNGYRGDKDLYVFNDSTYLFSSKALEGYGGYDIFAVSKQNGTWTEPVNLGPEVNSIYDDTAPFLTAGGVKLLFSSNRLESLGGSDIYVTNYVAQQDKWLLPANLGIPINSAGNESSIYISKDGNQALVSSDRVGGEGGYDLYLMYLKEQVTDQLKYVEELSFLTPPVSDMTMSIPKEKTTSKEPNLTKSIEFISNDLFFQSEQDILSPNNIVALNNLVALDKIIPDLQYRVSSFSVKEGTNSNSLFFSVKRAEKVRDYLTKNGIEKDKIIVEGYGASAPLVNEALGNAIRFNNRIEIDITNAQEKRVDLIRKQGILTEDMKLTDYNKFSNMKKGLSYSVKLTSTNQLYRSDILEQSDESMIIKEKDGKYTYYLGFYDKYQNVRLAKLNLQQSGELNAQIVTFINGVAIDDADLEKYAESYPDIKEYLRYK